MSPTECFPRAKPSDLQVCRRTRFADSDCQTFQSSKFGFFHGFREQRRRVLRRRAHTSAPRHRSDVRTARNARHDAVAHAGRVRACRRRAAGERPRARVDIMPAPVSSRDGRNRPSREASSPPRASPRRSGNPAPAPRSTARNPSRPPALPSSAPAPRPPRGPPPPRARSSAVGEGLATIAWPLVQPSNAWGDGAAIFSAGTFGLWGNKQRWGAKLGGASLISALLALALSNFGVIPNHAPAYDAVVAFLLPLAVPLLLLTAGYESAC